MIYTIAWFVMGFGTGIMWIIDDYINYNESHSILSMYGIIILLGCFGPIFSLLSIVIEISENGIGDFFTKKRFVK